MGEVDGAVLDDGTVIHWPPHLSDRISGIAVRGDQVRVTGWIGDRSRRRYSSRGSGLSPTSERISRSRTTHRHLRHRQALAADEGRYRRPRPAPGHGPP